jgi:hypothetical protein
MRKNTDTTYCYFDGTGWSASSQGAIRQLTCTKIYSYRDYNTNTLAEKDTEGHWALMTPDAIAQLSGMEQGHVYDATPYEDENDHQRSWAITSLRAGDASLVDFGMQESNALKTDFEFKATDAFYRKFRQRVEAIGGIVHDHTIQLADLQAKATDAESLRADLERLYAQAQALLYAGQPDAANVNQAEQWREEAILYNRRYEQIRFVLQQDVAKLSKDKGRSDEKAQAQALLLALPVSTSVSGISGILASLIAARAQALAAGNPLVGAHPAMALLNEALREVYGVAVDFDGKEEIKVTVKGRELILTPAKIEVR